MREREHVLQLENITMQFGGVVAANNLSLERSSPSSARTVLEKRRHSM